MGCSILGYQQDIIKDEWKKNEQFSFLIISFQIKGCRLSIIGGGVIGEAVGNIGKNGFGMDVVSLNHEQVEDKLRHFNEICIQKQTNKDI